MNAASKPMIIGVGMTEFGRHLTRPVRDLAGEAIRLALADAALSIGDIQMVYFGNATQGATEGQGSIRGQVVLRHLGFEGIGVVNVENACATGATALIEAAKAVRAGACDIALAVGVEKMVFEDRGKMAGVFEGGMDVTRIDQTIADMAALGNGVTVPDDFTGMAQYSPFMDVYAGLGRMHMREYGTTIEQIAAVAAKNHQNSVLNPHAQYRRGMTVEEVLNARGVTYPLTVAMCAPVSDGAAAAIVCSPAVARRRGLCGRALAIEGTALRSGVDRDPRDLDRHISALTAHDAYAAAGMGPGDMSLAEVHDATAVGEIMQIEHLGFCPRGEGGPYSARGATRIDGRIPVNPSGGLEAKGHPIGATGLGQIYELATQLRGEAGARQVAQARFGIAENGGGVLGAEEAVCAVTILSAPAKGL
ncbi:thiolase family protein [Sphingomonas sp. SFZ2018-12]|uniref:thiolase family protein n=1 Tax=Sphingomonas sp. SFZ2018-12 TaxID=2683197 RepID=UPI001F10BF4E|nr:thiolase family protein [Sphingomonas sp. SFZ2018-12]MCH4893655.1 thiolase family protein [Sphingomonas sp. SFZ2018-12]